MIRGRIFKFSDISIPPPAVKKEKGKSKKKKTVEGDDTLGEEAKSETEWRYFATMQEALSAGWTVSSYGSRR